MNAYQKRVSIPFITILLLIFSGLAGSRVFALPGDVDANGSVTIVDALKVAQYYVGFLNSLQDITAADVNCDQRSDIVDALIIARFSVGLLTELQNCNNQYPLVIPALSSNAVKELQAEFDALNNNAVFAEIDQFGLLSADYNMPYDQKPSGAPLTDEEEILRMTRETLIKNSRFTNVTETTPLDNYTIWQVPASNSYWIINYTFDTYNGIKMFPLSMRIEFKQYAYYITGCYPHPDIIIPETEKISLEQAKASVTGKILTYYNFAGEPVDYEITESSLASTPGTKAIIPNLKTDRLEYRYCWEIWIADRMWYIYVDVMTGETIKITQNFQT